MRRAGDSRRCIVAGFQSTHSLRSATRVELLVGCQVAVSIHALLAECDTKNVPSEIPSMRFNPRTPCGVRPGSERPAGYLQMFQSTHSLRSATGGKPGSSIRQIVSIHALLAECDAHRVSSSPSGCSFNPRTPCGVRQASLMNNPRAFPFQSTHSLRSATGRHLPQREQAPGFNPRTPCGVRPDDKS